MMPMADPDKIDHLALEDFVKVAMDMARNGYDVSKLSKLVELVMQIYEEDEDAFDYSSRLINLFCLNVIHSRIDPEKVPRFFSGEKEGLLKMLCDLVSEGPRSYELMGLGPSFLTDKKNSQHLFRFFVSCVCKDFEGLHGRNVRGPTLSPMMKLVTFVGHFITEFGCFCGSSLMKQGMSPVQAGDYYYDKLIDQYKALASAGYAHSTGQSLPAGFEVKIGPRRHNGS